MKVLHGSSAVVLLVSATLSRVEGFQWNRLPMRTPNDRQCNAQLARGGTYLWSSKNADGGVSSVSSDSKKENKAMAFLRKKGKVGGTTDFTNALGVDEGNVGKEAIKFNQGTATKKALGAYKSCTESGVIDDLTEEFPITCSGTQWAGVTDRVMGGHSEGTLAREEYQGRMANVLKAHVRLENNGGFVQMATDLALNPAVSPTVDASNFDGIVAELYYDGKEEKEDFNVHLKNASSMRPFANASFRSTFALPRGEWTKIRIPWSEFQGHGFGKVENNFDPSTLRRMGVVSIGKKVDITLALSSVGFYKN